MPTHPLSQYIRIVLVSYRVVLVTIPFLSEPSASLKTEKSIRTSQCRLAIPARGGVGGDFGFEAHAYKTPTPFALPR